MERLFQFIAAHGWSVRILKPHCDQPSVNGSLTVLENGGKKQIRQPALYEAMREAVFHVKQILQSENTTVFGLIFVRDCVKRGIIYRHNGHQNHLFARHLHHFAWRSDGGAFAGCG
jgi:hypothetical protein